MDGKSRFGLAVLALLAAFALVCGTWYLARTSYPESYRVSAARSPAAADASSGRPEEDVRPDSLLPGETVNINAADHYDLQRLPGIGEKRARDIIDYREAHGPFQAVEDLTEVSGIGAGIVDGLREYVCVE